MVDVKCLLAYNNSMLFYFYNSTILKSQVFACIELHDYIREIHLINKHINILKIKIYG